MAISSALSAVKSIPSENNRLAALRLARSERVGPRSFHALLALYGSAEAALEAVPGLAQKGGKPIKLRSAAEAEKEYASLKDFGAELLLKEEYPPTLAAIEDAPPVLTYKGRRELLTKPCIGIVGARNASLAGMKMAAQLAEGLGKANYVVVSGLARGIDAAAHKASLATGSIAVIAGGINSFYPPENKSLQEQLSAEGLVLAEQPFGAAPKAEHFPQRNRIISGLSLGLAVVEASLRSGSLITARLALEQGRDVFAVPGSPLDPRAEGPNRLIKQGAALIESAQDILYHLPSAAGPRQLKESSGTSFQPAPLPDSSAMEEVRRRVSMLLSTAPISVDMLLAEFPGSANTVHLALLELELGGRLERLAGNKIALTG